MGASVYLPTGTYKLTYTQSDTGTIKVYLKQNTTTFFSYSNYQPSTTSKTVTLNEGMYSVSMQGTWGTQRGSSGSFKIQQQ